MAITDNRTPGLNLPLPVSTNKLKDDCGRIAEAFTQIDATLAPVSVFEDLRSRKPAREGERVYLSCHTAPALAVFRPEGGGWFTGHLTAQADDGGYIASGGGAWHWKRDKEIEDLYIGDFGGIADGITDAQPAFKANMDFIFGDYARLRSGGTESGSTVSGGYAPYLGIQFGCGNYYITPGDYTKYGKKLAANSADQAFNPSGYTAAGGLTIRGAQVSSGKQVATRIISDKSDAPVFLINHRRVTFTDLLWDGQQTTKVNKYNKDTNPAGTNMLIGATQGVFNDTASNKQPFLTNQCPGGCFAQIHRCQAQDTGSHTFYLLDTLDSIVEGCFSSTTAGPVIKVGWSGQTVGVWDHSTSLEIRNCNFSTPVAPAIWAPRSAQGRMINVWFEHGNVPFDINQGQWEMSTICIEDCTKILYLWGTKFTLITLSNPTGNQINKDSPTSGNWSSYPQNPDNSALTSWIGGYDFGSWMMQSYGAYFDAPLRANWFSGVLRGTNNTDSNLWVNVGTFRWNSVGGSFKVRVHGGSYYGLQTAPGDLTTDRLPGTTTINVQRGQGAVPKINCWFEGTRGVVAAAYEPQVTNDILPSLWVCIGARVGEYSISVEGTGETRLEAGTPSYFKPNGATQNGPSGLTDVTFRLSMHNGSAGFGVHDDVVAIKTATVNSNDLYMTSPVSYVSMDFNGKQAGLPIFAYKPKVTTQPVAKTVAAGSALTLTVAGTNTDSYQWYKDGAAIAGATSATYTKEAAAAADAGNYYAVLNAAPTGNNTQSNTVAVTVS